VVFLALGGLASGLLTGILMYPREEAGWFGGTTFGVFLVVPLLATGILRNTIKALGLIGVTTFAYVFSYLITFGLQIILPGIVPSSEQWDMGTNEPAAPAALFVGGLVGAFLVFFAVISLCQPGISSRALARKALQGALLGGVLGVAGWALRSSVGVALWYLFHALGFTPWSESSPREWFHNQKRLRAKSSHVFAICRVAEWCRSSRGLNASPHIDSERRPSASTSVQLLINAQTGKVAGQYLT
jgi:hypothetical protein